jgi:hypothetical protein
MPPTGTAKNAFAFATPVFAKTSLPRQVQDKHREHSKISLSALRWNDSAELEALPEGQVRAMTH